MHHTKVEITHPDRVLFPDSSVKSGITKRDLVDYYQEVADTMLRHLRSRPLSVQRFPRGIDRHGFVQQDFADSLPDWMGRAEVAREGKEGGTLVHPVADSRAALAWLANQNCITLHDPWVDMTRHSRSLDGPIKRAAKLRA
jgi:bifunctional non-homologous end joining protein LigD